MHLAHWRIAIDDECRVDGGNLSIKLDVHDRPDDADDLARAHTLVHMEVGSLLKRRARLF